MTITFTPEGAPRPVERIEICRYANGDLSVDLDPPNMTAAQYVELSAEGLEILMLSQQPPEPEHYPPLVVIDGGKEKAPRGG